MKYGHSEYGGPPPEAPEAQQYESTGEMQKRLLYEEIELQLGWAVGMMPSEFDATEKPRDGIRSDIQSLREQLRSDSEVPVADVIVKLESLLEHLKEDQRIPDLQAQDSLQDFIRQLGALNESQKEYKRSLPTSTEV